MSVLHLGFSRREHLRVEVEEIWRVIAVHVVPPVAGEELLFEDGSVGAQEALLAVVVVARVEHLRERRAQSRQLIGL